MARQVDPNNSGSKTNGFARRQVDVTAEWPGRAVELVTGSIEQKRRYREYKARVERLPEGYRRAIDALQWYSYYFGHVTTESGLSMLEGLAGLFEQGAASGTPVREIVGADPVKFAEAFISKYPDGQWIAWERERLTSAIARTEDEGSR
jgi:DNA-binding ferritin-like protein (Dps family)